MQSLGFSEVCDWFENNALYLIGKTIEGIWEPRYPRRRGKEQEKDERLLPRNSNTIRKLVADMKSRMNLNYGNQKCETIKSKTGRLPYTPEVSAIIEAFHFSPKYHDVLALHIHVANIPLLDILVDGPSPRQIMSRSLDLSERDYEKFFSRTSELLEKGLFGMNGRYTNRQGKGNRYEMTEKLKDVLHAQCRTPEAVKRVVLGKPQKATLKNCNFTHIREEYDWLRNLLTNALAKKQRAVNILFYGNSGTGKTELAKTLCKEIGTTLYAVSDDLSEERKSIERRSDLASALCLLRDDRNSVLMMDEAEDVFGASRASYMFFGNDSFDSCSKSKLFFNRLLENNPVPVIWISNSISGVDPALLRRFSYALNVEAPDQAVQAHVWNYSARKNNIKLPKEKIDALVRTYDIAPAIIDTSLRMAALTSDHGAIEKTIDSLQTAMRGQFARREFSSEHEFSTDLLNCDTDLEKLAHRIISVKGVNFSLCLYGVPGSGKSAYARFLAEKLQMKVLHKRASDLISMWVGQTEQNIAAAFAEAKRKKMLLVFDEADSFLQDRQHARNSWEITQVNEMLTQMESHPLPFVCTTNLMYNLDQASLRRFAFKVKYDYLTHKQTETAFRHFFNMEPAISLGGLTRLSPGDFAVVAKKARICGIGDQKELFHMLRQEQDVKDDAPKTVGFTVR